MKKAKRTTPAAVQTVIDPLDREWTPIKAEEWQQHLRQTRLAMMKRVAVCGFDLKFDSAGLDRPEGVSSIGGLILEHETGRRLLPALFAMKADLDRNVTRLGDPDTDVQGDSLSDLALSYAIAAAECGFLLGLIAGTCVPWQVVRAIEPSHELATDPYFGSTRTSAKKGGAQ